MFKTFLFVIFTVLSFASSSVLAATIHYCNASQKRCIIQLSEGQRGDKVRVIDESAYLIDTGKIILVQKPKAGQGTYAVIELKKKASERRRIVKGYPVIVELEHEGSHLIWNSQIGHHKRK